MAKQAWAYPRLTAQTSAPLWCGDLLVTGPRSRAIGDLGQATTPGTGFGVVLANLQASTMRACAAIGQALADGYDGAQLPDGSQGGLSFTTRSSGVRS